MVCSKQLNQIWKAETAGENDSFTKIIELLCWCLKKAKDIFGRFIYLCSLQVSTWI
jgi:hypothetical protein